MIDRKTKLRLRRNVRKGRKQVENISVFAEDQIERNFIRRLHRLLDVRRFVFGWLSLVLLMIGASFFQLRALGAHYLKPVAASGGVYTEGIIGSFTNANPLYITGGVDSSVSKLLFSSLFTYSADGKLIGDIATSWKVDDTNKVYTVTIRDDVKWHDGEPLTVDDILFTYKLIQNPNAGSPLFSSWRDVKIAAIDEQTVTFTLPNVFAAFPYSMTNGIVPSHILEEVEPEQLRSDTFNTVRPVGSGPFRWETVEVRGDTPENRQEQVALIRNEAYYRGAPKLQRFIIKTFRDEKTMSDKFQNKELTAMSGLSSISDELVADESPDIMNIPLSGSVMVFFNTSQAPLNEKPVRQALVSSVDTTEIVNNLPLASIKSDSPLLRGQLGYDPTVTQLPFDLLKAEALLDEAGWLKRTDGFRYKDDVKLQFSLKAPSTSEYTYVLQQLQLAWQKLGVSLNVDQPTDSDLQSLVSLHQYDAVLYSISIGEDPDVFAFWHSSQADVLSVNRLNLSEYQSTAADQALEGGRTRSDPELRVVKYKPFLEVWREDAPALALYQPRYLYVSRNTLTGFESQGVTSAADRFANVQNWSIKTTDVYKN